MCKYVIFYIIIILAYYYVHIIEYTRHAQFANLPPKGHGVEKIMETARRVYLVVTDVRYHNNMYIYVSVYVYSYYYARALTVKPVVKRNK